MGVIKVPFDEVRLKRRLRGHLRSLGFSKNASGRLEPPSLDKTAYRDVHRPQRDEKLRRERLFFDKAWPKLCGYFAEGSEVDVDKIRVRLELIFAASWQSDLFRLACLLWSVPVSQGFGRRLRFLVWDDNNGKLIGLFALGDPVFNLKARDNDIGWTGHERGERLVNMLDAYVLGAVPPYSLLLGGKLVAAVIRTREVAKAFRDRYRSTQGIISGKSKNAQLVAVTTTSALGRSSIYNRLKLEGQSYFDRIGFTTGYGHFHFPDDMFEQMRQLLHSRQDAYASNHGYGQGPNWRLRTIRRALEMLGLDPKLVKHGLPREVFFCALADNARLILKGERKRPDYSSLRALDDVARLAIDRWVIPRAQRDKRYLEVTREGVRLMVTDAGAVEPRPVPGSSSACSS